jgi:hypothetical protein
MIAEEFNHFIRLVSDQELDKDTLKSFFKIVFDSPVGKLISQQADGAVMVYHERDMEHCYDIPLSSDLSKIDGDVISKKLLAKLPFDFTIEASTSV